MKEEDRQVMRKGALMLKDNASNTMRTCAAIQDDNSG